MTKTLTDSETNHAGDNAATDSGRPLDDAQTHPAEPHSGTDTDINKLVNSKESGGREGLDPTRYGDWEKAGRCIDF